MTIGRRDGLPLPGFGLSAHDRLDRAGIAARREDRPPPLPDPRLGSAGPGSTGPSRSARSPQPTPSSSSLSPHPAPRRPTNPNYGAPLTALLPLLQRGGRNGSLNGSHSTHRGLNPYARPLSHPRHPGAVPSSSAPTSSAPSPVASASASTSGPSASTTSTGRPVQRSRNGCYTCRKRKVKCDERTPVCIKCEYSGRSCEWPPEDPVIRRKNRPRKMKLHLVSDSRPTTSPTSPAAPAVELSDEARRSMRVPLNALQAFAATLPKLDPRKGYASAPSEALMPGRLRAGLMTDSAFLAPYFPAVDERLIFRHFVLGASTIRTALDDERSPWNPWVVLVAPLAFAHLPGESPAGDALRAAILAIGSVHLHFLDGAEQSGAGKMMALARPAVFTLIRAALSSERERSSDDTDLILAALLACVSASALAADDAGWPTLLRDVVDSINQLGGAAALLDRAPRDRLSISRFALEQIAIRDAIACVTTDAEPVLLREGFSEVFLRAGSWSRSDHEWESVERFFGISRGMADLVAKTCTLVSHVRRSQADGAASSGAGGGGEGGEGEDGLEAEADSLMAELKVWDEGASFTPFHPRTQYGNMAHRHAISIRLIRDVFNCPPADRRVQAAARAIVELAAEAVTSYGAITWLAGPVFIAGCQLPEGDPGRDTVRCLLSAQGPNSCFDIVAAKDMVEAHWRTHDGVAADSATTTTGFKKGDIAGTGATPAGTPAEGTGTQPAGTGGMPKTEVEEQRAQKPRHLPT